MKHKLYLDIVSRCESYLMQFGDSHQGVGWPKEEGVDARYRVMLEVIREDQPTKDKITLLDFGCGASHLYEYILRNGISHIAYSGLDLSTEFIKLSRQKFPSIKYYCLDVLEDESDLPNFDYIVMNGIFTQKCNLEYEDMLIYLQETIDRVFKKARVGIAFNVISKQVDWERDDLFHLPFDTLATFLTNRISRHFIFRHDYGLYEYTTYVFKQKAL